MHKTKETYEKTRNIKNKTKPKVRIKGEKNVKFFENRKSYSNNLFPKK